MPYFIDAPFANLIRNGCNNGVRSALSMLPTSSKASTAGDQDAPTAANHIVAELRPERAPAFAARSGRFCVSGETRMIAKQTSYTNTYQKHTPFDMIIPQYAASCFATMPILLIRFIIRNIKAAAYPCAASNLLPYPTTIDYQIFRSINLTSKQGQVDICTRKEPAMRTPTFDIFELLLVAIFLLAGSLALLILLDPSALRELSIVLR